MVDILVSELRDEHRDREWVDTYGYHWMWLDDAWAWHFAPEDVMRYPPEAYYAAWHKVELGVENLPRGSSTFGPGPFMEAVHHRAVWGKDWKRGW